MKTYQKGDVVTLKSGDKAVIDDVGQHGTMHGTRTNSKGDTFKESWSQKTGWSGTGTATEDIRHEN